jgi:hypothetical protein
MALWRLEIVTIRKEEQREVMSRASRTERCGAHFIELFRNEQLKVKLILCLIKYNVMKMDEGVEERFYRSWSVHCMKRSGQLHLSAASWSVKQSTVPIV